MNNFRIFLAAGCLALAACGGGDEPEPVEKADPAPPPPRAEVKAPPVEPPPAPPLKAPPKRVAPAPKPKAAPKVSMTTTASGLQYEVLNEGDGAKPSATDTVTVHYHGTLTDGTVFDSSVDRGQPASFPLNRVIPGWTEGVQLMSVGSKYRFTIPPDLGYGSRGAGGVIPPNATLIFEVELLSIP